ncbi:MAG TPA: hypothetical protein VIN08_28220 [Ohtaekwangia sp.]|uniref:hypothetical protein n=1 Tax=Ohtaekwangia sp. TaxID=2066019 RepID=UPI002F94E262
MLKKSLCYVVLVTMMLHCASRLGVLSFLYENRHSIGYSIGLIAEIPIAMCSSDYDFSKGLKIEHRDSDQGMPRSFMHAREINLFFISSFNLPEPPSDFHSQKWLVSNIQEYHSIPVPSVFHPPAVQL